MALRDRARRRVASAARRVGRAFGQDIVARNFYSPVPRWESLAGDVFERRSPLGGIDLDLDAGIGFLSSLEPFLREFEPPTGFDWGNGMYDSVEADVLYAVIRHQRPKRVIELGSEVSSLIIIAAATCRNAAEGSPARYTAHDPFPREFARRGVEGLELRAESAAEVQLAEFGSSRPATCCSSTPPTRSSSAAR